MTYTPVPFNFSTLSQYKRFDSMVTGYPHNLMRFFAPEDNVHDVLMAVLGSARIAVAIAMYGYDDPDINNLLLEIAACPEIPVQMALDKSQAGGVHEKALIDAWPHDIIGNSMVIGTSSVAHAISHTKLAVVDGLYTIQGSTNWSQGGESAQNNELTVVMDAVFAAETRAKIDMVHSEMAKQMGLE